MPSDVEKLRVCSSTGLLASYGYNAITSILPKILRRRNTVRSIAIVITRIVIMMMT